jgi:hypothetical protein
MNGGLILQSHNTKYTPLQFFDCCPKSVSIVFLGLGLEGVLDDADTPLLFDVWPLAQDLIFKVIREPVFRHVATAFPVLHSAFSG